MLKVLMMFLPGKQAPPKGGRALLFLAARFNYVTGKVIPLTEDSLLWIRSHYV
jgi:hypothetical protein